MLEPYMVVGLDANENRMCSVDWPRLARNQNGRTVMVRSARLHALMWTKYAYVHDKLMVAHNQLACRLAKPDCHPSVSQILNSPPRTDLIPPEARDRVTELLQLMRLDTMAERKPNQLSGGQQQRVALARSIG